MTGTSAGWYYVKKGMLEDVTIGPVPELDQLFQEYLKGELKPETQILHSQHTQNAWVPFSRTKLCDLFQAKRQQIQAEAEQRKAAERKRLAEEHEARDAEREAIRKIKAQESEREAELVRQKKQQDMAYEHHRKALEGSDRWPSLVRYARVLEVWAVLMFAVSALFLMAPGIAFAASGILALIAAIGLGAFWGILASLGSLIVGIALAAVGVGLAYIVLLGIQCMADFLKCIAAIEANTRRMWHSEQSVRNLPQVAQTASRD